MKKLVYIFAVLLLTAACYQDKSTVATFEYPDILIKTSVTADTLFCFYGETVSFSAEATQEGVSEEQLEYFWEMDMRPGSSKDRLELGSEKSIEYRILNSPSTSPYYLTLTVTNLETGFSRYRIWPVYVSNSLGEGVLVANTRDKGATYELDLVATSSVTYGYSDSKARVTKALYSLGNGEPLKNRVTSLLARNATNFDLAPVSSYNYDIIMVGTEKELTALSPVSYGIEKSGNNLMASTKLDSFDVQALFNGGNYSSFAIINNRLFTCCDMLDCVYAAIPCPDDIKNSFTTSNTCGGIGSSGCMVFRYSDETHSFYSIHCWSAFQSSMTVMNGESAPEPSFLADKSCVACGAIKGERGCFVLKDTEGKYWCAVVGNSIAATTFELKATDIDKAEHFAFCDNADFFYYSVGSKVYSTVLSGNTASTTTLNWAPDSENEKVTMMRQYRQAWFGIRNYDQSTSSESGYKFPLAYHRLQMLMVTYNESTGEGKIYMRPFIVSTGMFSVFKNNGTVGGFGEITAIGTTLR